MRQWLLGSESSAGCGCEPAVDGDRLVVDANACDERGRLRESSDCRAAVVRALADRRTESVVVRANGRERAYLDRDAALFAAAGAFHDRVGFHDAALAERAAADPLAAAREASGRAGAVADIAVDTGLDQWTDWEGYDALSPAVGLEVGHARVRPAPPEDGRLVATRELSTGATVRRYERPGEALDAYHLDPVEARLSADALATLTEARERVASGAVGGERAARRAVRRVASDDDPVERIADVLEKHTADLGVLVDLFADDAVSDVFATAPVAEGPLRCRVDGDLRVTNVRLTAAGPEALASQFRLRSGRAFSRASPTLDATTAVGDRRIRVAGTTDPVSDGVAFAFRAHDRQAWTLRRLVGNDTLPPAAAALLSLTVRRAGATLVAGTRGAGKTTLLGALLWELPPEVRTLVIEDTPELPVEALQDDGRDVQSLLTTTDDGPGLDPAEALRTALRLGEGALVVGEVRGEEAAVLYEAMRVGASGSAVLGTIHGDGGESVRERVVSDLNVPESSFATTDLVVTLEPYEVEGERRRRVRAIEEVVDGSDGVRFASLFDLENGRLAPTGRVNRGNSRLVETIADPAESYADVRAALAERAERLGGGRGESVWTDPEGAPC